MIVPFLYHGAAGRDQASIESRRPGGIIRLAPPLDARGDPMTLPAVIESLWNNLQSARAPILDEVAGLSQAQADWRPTESDWSIGEILHHLTLAEVATGKLTSKLLKDAGETRSGFPAGLSALAALPPFPPGPREAPDPVRPGRGHAIGQLLADFQATRERSRQSVERLA